MSKISSFVYHSVVGQCPACHRSSLFLAAGGYVTCQYLHCPDPGAASDLLTDSRRQAAVTEKTP